MPKHSVEVSSHSRSWFSSTDKLGLLILEDERPTRKFLAQELRKEGFRVCVVERGVQAIQEAADPAIQLVLLDIRVPGRYNGIETAYRILEKHPDKAVIFVTAHSQNEEYQYRAMELGLQRIKWVPKPSTEGQWKELLHHIQSTLAKQRIERFIEKGAAEGIEFQSLIRLLRRLDPGLSEDLIFEVIQENKPTLIPESQRPLSKVRASSEESPADFRVVQALFASFEETVIRRLRDDVEKTGEDHRRIASDLEAAVRSLSAPIFEIKHVEILEFLLRRLWQFELTPEEVRTCRRFLRHHGIDTVVDSEKHRRGIWDAYPAEDREQAEAVEDTNQNQSGD